MMTPSQKKQLTSPAFWATIITALGAIGSGLMEIGNPVTIAIGAAVTAVYTVAQKIENVAVLNNQTQGDAGVIEKASALVPIVEQQVGNVATLIKTVNDHIDILKYRMKGYEVTPHVDSPTQTHTLGTGYAGPQTVLYPPSANAPPAPQTTLPGGAHEVIGKGT